MLVAVTCAAAVTATLTVAAAVRPPESTVSTATPPVSTSVATTATSAPPSVPGDAELAALVPGRLSVLVHDRRTRRDVVSYRPDAAYPAASLVKLLIALEARKRGVPSAEVAELLSGDDAVTGRWWTRLGGPAIVTGWAARLGLTGTRPPADPRRWEDTVVTAADLARGYRSLLAEGARPEMVMEGASCCSPARNLHAAGVLADDRYIVVVLTAQPAELGRATAAERVAAVVKALSVPLGSS
jgi:hypothetical protein